VEGGGGGLRHCCCLGVFRRYCDSCVDKPLQVPDIIQRIRKLRRNSPTSFSDTFTTAPDMSNSKMIVNDELVKMLKENLWSNLGNITAFIWRD
jgi:hypothetical protein